MGKNIAHYTRFEFVSKILESKQLWATNFQFLNDSSEIHYAKELLRASFRLWELDHRDTKTTDEVEKLIDELYVYLGTEIYVTSFCEYPDPQGGALNPQGKEEGLLSMWRGYGKDGGCAIVFDKEEAGKSFLKNRGMDDSSHVKFHGVQYGLDKRNSDEFFKKLQELSEKWKMSASEKIFCNREISSDALRVIPFSKHRGFREEKELRLVVFPGLPKIDELQSDKSLSAPLPVFYREDGVPCVKLNYAIASVKKIVVGPHVDQSLRVKELEHFIKTTEGFAHIKVVPSCIPFLG